VIWRPGAHIFVVARTRNALSIDFDVESDHDNALSMRPDRHSPLPTAESNARLSAQVSRSSMGGHFFSIAAGVQLVLVLV
jgi:hypothetical protein